MKKLITFGLPLLLLALVLAGCDSPAATPLPGSVTYEYLKGGSTYKLTITQSTAKAAYTPVVGDTYILLIITGGQTKTSSGTIAGFSNNMFTLKPSNSTVTFTVQISGNAIVKVSGTITLEGSGGTVKGPDTASGSNGGGSGSGNGNSSSNGNGSGDGSGNGTGSGSGGGSLVGTVNSVDELLALIGSLPPNTSANPYLIALNTSDISGISGIEPSVGIPEIMESKKYVNLDLSGSNITSIGSRAFLGCSRLTGITISNTVTSIGNEAFHWSGLTSVTIPDKRKMTHFTQLQG